MAKAYSRRRGPYAKTAERRQRILDAALQVFAAHGYRAGSMREVARVADMSLSKPDAPLQDQGRPAAGSPRTA